MPRRKGALYRRRVAAQKKSPSYKKKMSYPDSFRVKAMSQYSAIYTTWNAATALPNVMNTGSVVIAAPYINSPAGTANIAGSFTFGADQIPQFKNLASSWDRYRVNKIHVKVIPNTSIAAPNASVSSSLPVFRLVRDLDDNTVSVQINTSPVTVRPLTSSDIWSRRGKDYRLNKPLTFSFVPRVVQSAQSTSPSSPTQIPSTTVKCPFLNTAVNNIEFYGFKWGLKNYSLPTAATTLNANTIAFQITYDITFANLQYFDPSQFPSMEAMGMVLPGDTDKEAYYYDASGNVYDKDNNLVASPDASGNEVPVV